MPCFEAFGQSDFKGGITKYLLIAQALLLLPPEK